MEVHKSKLSDNSEQATVLKTTERVTTDQKEIAENINIG